MKVLITGGANGIGKETIKQLRDEHEITVIDRDGDALKSLEGVEKLHLDITNRDRVQEELTGLEIDVLINCAGVQKQGAVEDMKIEEFEEHIYNNYIGYINTIKACLPSLRESEGKIINVSSIAGLSSAPFLSGYCASKHAVEGFTDALRRELKDIDVVLVEPGRVKTGFNEEGRDNVASYENSNYSDIYEKMLQRDIGGMKPEKAGKQLAYIALNGSKPRYTITTEAYLISKLEKILPARLVDLLFGKFMR